MPTKIGIPSSASSDEKTLQTVYDILGYDFTVTIYRRQNLNKIGRFLALNHDGASLRAYLKQCVRMNKLEPHEIVLEDGGQFTVDTVERSNSKKAPTP
jgi:hypothetical protein